MAEERESAIEAISGIEVQEWNRLTVADGQWLNDNDIKPLSARDKKLAEIIDSLGNEFDEAQSAFSADKTRWDAIADLVTEKQEEWSTGNYDAGTDIDALALADGTIKINTTSTANGEYAFAEGEECVASGEDSHAEGYSTHAIGDGSHAEGGGTFANGSRAHAEGGGTVAAGDYSHAEGGGTFAVGTQSHAEGGGTYAVGPQSHAEGGGTSAVGDYSHAEGGGTYAVGDYSHAEGGGTSAVGDYSHAEGESTSAIGSCSHAQGILTIADGYAAFAGGVSASVSSDVASGCLAYNYSTATNKQNPYFVHYDQKNTFFENYDIAKSFCDGKQIGYSYISTVSPSYSASGNGTNIAIERSNSFFGSLAIKGSLATKGGVAIQRSVATKGGLALLNGQADSCGVAIKNGYAYFDGVSIGHNTAFNSLTAFGKYNATTQGQYTNPADGSLTGHLIVVGNGKGTDNRHDAFTIDVSGNVSANDFIAANGNKLSECGKGGGAGTFTGTFEYEDLKILSCSFTYQQLAAALANKQNVRIWVHEKDATGGMWASLNSNFGGQSPSYSFIFKHTVSDQEFEISLYSDNTYNLKPMSDGLSQVNGLQATNCMNATTQLYSEHYWSYNPADGVFHITGSNLVPVEVSALLENKKYTFYGSIRLNFSGSNWKNADIVQQYTFENGFKLINNSNTKYYVKCPAYATKSPVISANMPFALHSSAWCHYPGYGITGDVTPAGVKGIATTVIKQGTSIFVFPYISQIVND